MLPFLDIGYQCYMRFYGRIGNAKIRTTVFFIPDEVLAPEFSEPVMNHLVVMNPNGSYVSMYIFISHMLRGVVAYVLEVA